MQLLASLHLQSFCSSYNRRIQRIVEYTVCLLNSMYSAVLVGKQYSISSNISPCIINNMPPGHPPSWGH